MKKFTFLLLGLFLSIGLFSQQVERNYVVVEIGTGTWCTYCPGAAMGADDLVENGHSVAIIENHNGDPYAWAGSNARNSYYGITGYPTAFFDGDANIVGGSHSSSLYASYLPLYNNAIAVMSDFTLDLSYTHTDLDYDVTIDITEPGDYSGTNLVIHLFLTESHIAENWQGQTELNFVNQAMYPDLNGTTFAGGSTTLNLSFTADAGWDLSNCELVAFIQDVGTKNILQSDKATLAEPTGTNNIGLEEINEIPEMCEGNVTPSLKVKNFGSEDITSLTIEYSINSGATTGTFDWTGDAIPFNHYSEITLDEISFDLLATNTIDIEITAVNGNSDDDPADNTANADFNEAPEGNFHLFLEINTDGWGEEVSWEIQNSSGQVLESGGNYADNSTINLDFFVDPDCNTFYLYDSYGDGGGAVSLEDSEGNQLFYTSGNYGSGTSQKFVTFAIAPTVGFDPANDDTDVDVNTNIIITFDQAVRFLDDSEITDGDISTFVTLTDLSKADIAFTGTINNDKNEITLDPDEALTELSEITVMVSGGSVENAFDLELEEASASFTTGESIGIESILNKLSITPNPADEFINISNAEDTYMQLIDITGKIVLTQKITSSFEKVNIGHLNSGLYTLVINSQNETVKQLIIVN